MNKKQNKGITLVALVITIIVLIILAGVSINAIMNDGLITNSKNAKDKWASKSAEEELGIAELDGLLAVETIGTIKAGESAGRDNKKYTDATGKTAIIPAGFTVSNIKYIQTINSEQREEDESKISDGLVIYSNKSNDASITITAAEYMAEIKKGTSGYTEEKLKQTYNQYVWIPVENPSDLYGILELPAQGIEEMKFGKLYFKYRRASSKNNWPTETGYSEISYREPAILSSYDTNSKYYKNILGYSDLNAYKKGMVQEFNDMITSVEKYKGFYIGRYELTGSETVPTLLKDADPLNTNWYNFYSACTKLEAGNVEAKDKVRTSMIWGCQWDEAVHVTLDKVSDFLNNNTDYGAFKTGGEQCAGTKNSAYNIYDMSGNLEEHTLEAANADYRTTRGGNYTMYYSYNPVGNRGNDTIGPTATGTHVGCRAQLYIK